MASGVVRLATPMLTTAVVVIVGALLGESDTARPVDSI
jgi:hypothetical protein